MESTLKIDYQGRGNHFVPIIKIVQPLKMAGNPEDEVFDDPKDKLISNFLHTPTMAQRNSFFEVSSHFVHPPENPEPSEQKVHRLFITTISAIEEEQLFRRMKWAIIHRLIDDNSVHEINQIIKGKGITQQDVSNDFHTFKRIDDFFNWVSKQDYYTNTTKGIRDDEFIEDTNKGE